MGGFSRPSISLRTTQGRLRLCWWRLMLVASRPTAPPDVEDDSLGLRCAKDAD